jgi:hypothetical protein
MHLYSFLILLFYRLNNLTKMEVKARERERELRNVINERLRFIYFMECFKRIHFFC